MRTLFASNHEPAIGGPSRGGGPAAADVENMGSLGNGRQPRRASISMGRSNFDNNNTSKQSVPRVEKFNRRSSFGGSIGGTHPSSNVNNKTNRTNAKQLRQQQIAESKLKDAHDRFQVSVVALLHCLSSQGVNEKMWDELPQMMSLDSTEAVAAVVNNNESPFSSDGDPYWKDCFLAMCTLQKIAQAIDHTSIDSNNNNNKTNRPNDDNSNQRFSEESKCVDLEGEQMDVALYETRRALVMAAWKSLCHFLQCLQRRRQIEYRNYQLSQYVNSSTKKNKYNKQYQGQGPAYATTKSCSVTQQGLNQLAEAVVQCQRCWLVLNDRTRPQKPWYVAEVDKRR